MKHGRVISGPTAVIIALAVCSGASAAGDDRAAWLRAATQEALSYCTPEFHSVDAVKAVASAHGWPAFEVDPHDASQSQSFKTRSWSDPHSPFVMLMLGSGQEIIASKKIERVDCLVMGTPANVDNLRGPLSNAYPNFNGGSWAGVTQNDGTLRPLLPAEMALGRDGLLKSLEAGQRVVSVELTEAPEPAAHIRIYEPAS